MKYSQPRPTGGAIVRIESKAPVAGSVAVRLDVRLEADALLGDRGAGEVGVVLVLLHLLHGCRPRGRRRRRRAARGSTRRTGRSSRRSGTSNGLTSYDETQVTSRCTGSGASSTGSAGHLGGDPRDGDRRLGHGDRLGLGQRDAGGEAPGAVEDDPHREAEVLGVLGALEHAVAHREVLVADALEAEVGVGDPEVAGPGQRHLAETLVGQGQERRIDLPRGHGPDPSRSSDRRRSSSRGGPCAPRAAW